MITRTRYILNRKYYKRICNNNIYYIDSIMLYKDNTIKYNSCIVLRSINYKKNKLGMYYDIVIIKSEFKKLFKYHTISNILFRKNINEI